MNTSDGIMWGFSHINNKQSSYLWSIKNYSCISIERGEKLESPVFSLNSDSNEKYCIAVWPKGSDLSTIGYMSTSFCNKSSHGVDIKFCISILDGKGNKFSECKKRNHIISNSFDGFNNFLAQSSLNETNGLIVNYIVTFFCEYLIVTGSINSTVSIYPTLRLKTRTLDVFEQQLDAEEFSDFTVIAPCGKKLFVHKFILAATSPVFSAMFKNNMKEKSDKTVTIKGTEYDVLKEMLRFMYAAKVENLGTFVYELVAVAEKYQIDGLKELCEEYFFKNINAENLKEILDLSHRYKLENLKNHIHKYLVCYSKSLFIVLSDLNRAKI